MIDNRELTLDDYLAMLRRRLKVILLPALLAPVAAYVISYAFPSRYTSQSLILVEEQRVPEGYVKPVITEDLTQRIATMQQQVLSSHRLQPVIEHLGLVTRGKTVDDVADDIRLNLSIEPVEKDLSQIGTTKKRSPGQDSLVPGFYVNFTAGTPRVAQQVCTELTSMLLQESLKSREQVAQSTTEFLSRQLDEAKHNLQQQDSKLAAFKKQYLGQLPGDEENNLKIQLYQGRVALSRGVEQQYKQLTRDYDTAQKLYSDLLGKKSESEMTTDMERRQQGEQMRLLNPASFPESPSFPNRFLFASGGLGAGLVLGLGLALWLELRDKAIRTEQDVEAALELPLLVSVPWLGANEPKKNGDWRFWGRWKRATGKEKPKESAVT